MFRNAFRQQCRILVCRILLCLAAACQWHSQLVVAQQSKNFSVSNCDFPPRGGGSLNVSALSEIQGCIGSPPDTNATISEAKAAGWQYAPDPVVYWNAATLVDAYNQLRNPQLSVNASGESFSDYYLLSRSFITINNATDKAEILAGAPINATTGLSSAKVYFTFFSRDDKFWVYNFNLFYSFNGCSNQILSLALDGYYNTTNYILCPEGIHEGDWERVSVVVCKKTKRVRQVILSQHGWTQHLDCDSGECTFGGPNGSNPVVYSALNSHANYPHASPAWVYAEVRLDFLPSLDGVYIVDRALASESPVKRFVPTPTNIVWLNTDPNLAGPDDPALWGLYLGKWGAPFKEEPRTIQCISQNQTQYVECPDNPATERLQEVIDILNGKKVRNDTAFDASRQIISSSITSTFGASEGNPAGPITRDYSYYWSPPSSAALWKPLPGILAFLSRNSGSRPVCPASGNPYSTFRVPVDWSNDDLQQYLIGIASGVIAFSVFMVLFLLLPPIFWPKVSTIRLAFAGAPREATAYPKPIVQEMGQRLRALESPTGHAIRVVWVLMALSLYIAGAVLVGLGCDSLWSTLNDLLSIDLWYTLRKIFIVVIVLVGVADLVFGFVLATLHPLRCCKLLPMCAASRKLKDTASKAPKKGNITSALMTGCVLFVISIVILLFAFGVTVTVTRKVFASACRRVVSKANGIIGGDNYCLNLQQFGLDRTYCLNDVASFCNTWEDLKVNYIVLGAVFMFWAHIMFLLLVARNFALTREYRLTEGQNEDANDIGGILDSSGGGAGDPGKAAEEHEVIDKLEV